MKILELLLYIAYKIFILFAGLALLFSIAIVAIVLDSWYYLLLYIPLFLYYYGSSIIDYKTKKPAFAKEKRLRR
jgi:hypothetical protein